MLRLYTSLIRLKQEMNGGTLPPMTPVPENIQHFIDPAFTIGLGALEEHPEKGLRCPVRGCGRFYRKMTKHLNAAHADVGGAEQVKRVLQIPRRAPLVCSITRDVMSAHAKRNGLGRDIRQNRRHLQAAALGRVRSKHRTKSGEARFAGWQNLTNTCKAQLSHRLIDLQHTLGREPTCTEAAQMISRGFVYHVLKTFGSWPNALSQCGLRIHRRKHGFVAADVLPGLAAYYEAHGCLPTNVGNRAHPLLYHPKTIMRALKAENWGEAMRRAASLLNIYGGRYGLPIEHKPKDEEAA